MQSALYSGALKQCIRNRIGNSFHVTDTSHVKLLSCTFFRYIFRVFFRRFIVFKPYLFIAFDKRLYVTNIRQFEIPNQVIIIIQTSND